MNRKDATHVGVVVAIALLARIALVQYVGVWHDYGFYAYNTRQMMAGQVPFVDFLGRSPLFLAALTLVRSVVGDPFVAIRGFVIVAWVATIVPVYFLGRTIRGHTTGLVSAVLFSLTPFPLVYMMWSNTQSLAMLLATTAILLVCRQARSRTFIVAGCLLGLAFLSRRSVVVVVPAILAWHVLYTDSKPVRQCVLDGGALVVAAVLTLLAGYSVLLGDVGRSFDLFEVHAVNLFVTTGRGGFPLLDHGPVPSVLNKVRFGRVPILNDICQLCGAWTARTFAKTLFVTSPVVGLLAIYWPHLTEPLTESHVDEYVYGIGGILVIYGVVVGVFSGYHLRSITLLVLGLFVYSSHRTRTVSADVLFSRKMKLLLFVLMAFAAGYLYRNRLIHTYYFADLWPFISVVAGVAVVAWWHGAGRIGRVILTVAFVAALVTSAAFAHPLTNVVVDGNEEGWFTADNLDSYEADLKSRTDPGDVVLTASPAYLSDTELNMVGDEPRLNYLYATFDGDGPYDPYERRILDGLRTGEIELVIVNGMTQNMLEINESVGRAFEDNYCRVRTADELYQRTGAFLYRHHNSCNRRPSIDRLENATSW